MLATIIAALVEKQLAQQSAKVDALLDEMRQQSRVDRESMRSVLDARINEVAGIAHGRGDELEARIDQVAHLSGVDYVDEQVGALAARLEEGLRSLRRFDEQAASLVQHVNDSNAALAKRMDDGDEAIAHAVEGRLAQVREVFETMAGDFQKQYADVNLQINSKLESSNAQITDRMLALETRVKDDFGTKVAELDATIGRIGSGFDDAMSAISQRVAEMDARLIVLNECIDQLAEQIGKVDETAINEVKEQVSTAIGEAMLMRIEVDRYVGSTDERFDKTNIRLAEVEAQMNDQMDVSATVQLERLDELERAVAQLDPTQFVRKAELTPPTTLPDEGSSTSEPSLSSF
jgi:ABC-type transporter Mla subunit MlaD